MYIINGVARAGTEDSEKLVTAVDPLEDMMMIVTFASGERRLFDASQLLAYPAFQPLRDEAVFRAASVEHGAVTWDNGEIDIAPESIYASSYAYEDMAM